MKIFMETSLKRYLAGLFLIIVMLALSGCRTIRVNSVIGVLSAVNAENLPAGVLILGAEQQTGYLQAESGSAASLPFIYRAESVQTDEIQVAVREMAEKDKVLAVIGATSNEVTMRTASLVNFFNLPMIVPTAGGDNLLPSNNLWAFRLSAPGTAYAAYMIDSLLNQRVNESPVAAPGLKIAILYEENTFGESAAVAAAQAAMKQKMELSAYSSFSPNNPDPDQLNAIFTLAKDGDAQVISLMSSNPQIAERLVQAFYRVYAGSNRPMLVGLAGGFASQEFLSSDLAEGVFVVRQKLDRETCPAGIQSIYAAQSYGALYILSEASRLVQENTPELRRLFVLGPPAADPVIDLRERLRDELKLTNMDVPCIGRVAFDNAGQIKDPIFEFVYMKDGKECDCSQEEFQSILLNMKR
jgi:ABC-type branched-subunit amino acid transport system substrate-binding protein